jgi:ribosomal protein L3 glutamine methyltransferase
MNNLPPDFNTVRDLLRLAVTRFNEAELFFGHGSDNAFDEAVYLILKSLSLPIDKLEPFLDARITRNEAVRIFMLMQRRINERIPAAYLTNEAWLQGYRFYVDQRVLIPRSFIAEMIVEYFSPWVKEPDKVKTILELCTGSGCLSIIMADTFVNADIDATDLSSDALHVAQINIAKYSMEDRIKLIQSDLFKSVPAKKYDLIVANPPYVTTASMETLPPEYQHEPAGALAGGTKGMDIIKQIVLQAKPYLAKNGFLIIEVGNEAENALETFPDLEMTWALTSGGDDRVFVISAADLP